MIQVINVVKQPGLEIGKKAAELIIKQIVNRKRKQVFRTIGLPIESIIRDSLK